MLNSDTKISAILRESWSVSWPMILIMSYEFVIGITDVFVAGRFGKEAQAAYGLAFQLYFLFMIIAIALSVGTVAVVSRLFTSGKRDELGRAIHSSVVMSRAAGLLFSIPGILGAGLLIGCLGVRAPLKPLAVPFMRIYALGFLFDYLLINSNAVLRSCGMAKRSLATMTIVCLLNVALNFLLALYTPLGFNGIAVATVISLCAGSMLNAAHMRKIDAAPGLFDRSVIKRILTISWPSGVLQILWQAGAMALFLIISLLPKENVEVLAAFTNGLKIESAIFLPAFAFNMANAVVVGNMLGRKDERGAFRGGLITAILGVSLVSVLTLVVIANAGRIGALLSNDPVVVRECARYMYIALLFEPVMAWGVILGGGLNGAGDTMTPMLGVGISIWALRLPLAYILGVRCAIGAAAIWWAMNVSLTAQAVFISVKYFSRRWITDAERVTVS
ncbi:MAG: MATE family efflux transporter [Candidatus Omnitrophota bacterium]